MKASYKKTDANYYPVIAHRDGSRETIHGDTLATPATAQKYAQIEINDRRHRAAAGVRLYNGPRHP